MSNLMLCFVFVRYEAIRSPTVGNIIEQMNVVHACF